MTDRQRQRRIVAQHDRLVTFFTRAVRKYPKNRQFRRILIEVCQKRALEAAKLGR